jgi:hypothetical protein
VCYDKLPHQQPLWDKVLGEENTFRRQLIDQVRAG